MKDIVIVDGNIRQYKGNFHMHTDRSWDSVTPYGEALREYQDKGYDFCVVTDHEVYWDSTECDTDSFIALSGVESAFILPEEKPYWLMDKEQFRSLHLNLINDETGGKNGFCHNQVLRRPIDLGLSSWNNYIEYCKANNQMVIVNHPNWSRMDENIFSSINGCFAFEIYNSGAVNGGCSTDEAIWDHALEKGRRILALTGDDTHKYGTDHNDCGGAFTMLSAEDFSRKGLVQAIKNGNFYPSTGPVIKDMRIVDNTLVMSFSSARKASIVARPFLGKAFRSKNGDTLEKIEWPVREGLKYFRVEIEDMEGRKAWSQPVFPMQLNEKGFLLREDPHTPLPENMKMMQEDL